MVPQVLTVIPLFLMMSAFGWVDSYQAPILPMAFRLFGTFMLRQFFLTIPVELQEPALLDGASHPCIVPTIFMPLARSTLGLLALFTFTGPWNAFLWPLIVVNGPDHAVVER